MIGVMLNDVSIAGVMGMELHEGQEVDLTKATNLPGHLSENFFARPINGIWSDGLDRADASILISPDEFVEV